MGSMVKSGLTGLTLLASTPTTEALWPFSTPAPAPIPEPSILGFCSEKIQQATRWLTGNTPEEKEEPSSWLEAPLIYTQGLFDSVTENPSTVAFTATAVAAAVTGAILYRRPPSILNQRLTRWVDSAPPQSKQNYETAKKRLLEYANSCKTVSSDKKGPLLLLDLSGLNLESLPPIFDEQFCSQIGTLDLRGNKLSDLPLQLGGLNQCIELLEGRVYAKGQEFKSLLDLWVGSATEDNKANYEAAKERINIFLETSAEAPKDDDEWVTLDLSNLNLDSLPPIYLSEQICSTLEHLNLDKNKLEQLPHQIGKLRELVSLGVLNNNLDTLPSEIKDLTKLGVLDLDGNQFTEIPPQLQNTGNFPKLYYLDFSRNDSLGATPLELGKLDQRIHVPGGVIYAETAEFDHLLMTWFDSEKISRKEDNKVPIERINEFLVNTEAALLNLDWLGLKSFPPIYLNGKIQGRLQDLNLKTNDLEKLPSEIARLSKLKRLNAAQNKLTNLPDTIKDLAQLESLDLSVNKFREIPPLIWTLPNLTVLDLAYNQIELLPDQVSNLTQLKVLDLRQNSNLSTLPIDQLANLIEHHNLQELWLEGTMVNTEELPQTIKDILHLTDVGLVAQGMEDD